MITHLSLRQFRNHSKLDLDINSNLITITGPNASGKTNILESIYISSLTKSFKVSDNKLIQHDKDFFTIDRVDDNIPIHLRFTQTPQSRSKSLKIKNSPKPLYSLVGRNPVTLFEPNDIYLLTGLPSLRRNYLDKILSQVDNLYLQNLSSYKKILHHRNSLLRRSKKETIRNLYDQLFVLNIQIIEPGYYLSKKRSEFIKNIKNSINNYYQSISGDNKKIDTNFLSCAKSPQELLSNIELALNTDIASGFSTVGPHKEDFNIVMDSFNLADSASRGELRSLVLSCKLSELDYIEKSISKRPTLLLDDVLSELDDRRQKFLLNNINKQQTFITTTHLPSNLALDFQHIELPL